MDTLMTAGRSLRDFQTNSLQSIFTDADTYPAFFSKHLVHPRRKIKVFLNDPNANIRAFYFQYLVLCFEMENPNSELYINKLHLLLGDPNFTFLFLQDDNQEIFNDKQFKRFFLQFLDILESGQFETVQQAINRYQIIDLVLVYFFRSLLIFSGITQDFDSYVDRNILFGFFMQSFRIDVAIFEEKCLKFFQAEMFLYEQSPEEIYLVYKQLDNQSNSAGTHSQDNQRETSHKSSIQQNISLLQDYDLASDKTPSSKKNGVKMSKQEFVPQQDKMKKEIKAPESYHYNSIQSSFKQQSPITSEFDYRTVTPNTNARGKQDYFTKNPKKQEANLIENSIKNNSNNQGGQARTTRATTIMTGPSQSSPQYIQDSKIQRPSRHTYYEQNSHQSFSQNQSIFTPPTPNNSHNLSQPYEIIPSYTNANIHEGSRNFTKINERKVSLNGKTTLTENHPFSQRIMEKLNISKEFTDSFTLAKMGEPYKSEIKAMKNRSRQFRQSLLLSFQPA